VFVECINPKRPRSRGTNTIQEFLHFAHGLAHADKDRTRNDAVADIELNDLRNLCEGNDVGVIETMSAMDFETKDLGRGCSGCYRLSFLLLRRPCNVAVSSRVDFNGVRADFSCRLDLCRYRIDEQADMDTAIL